MLLKVDLSRLITGRMTFGVDEICFFMLYLTRLMTISQAAELELAEHAI